MQPALPNKKLKSIKDVVKFRRKGRLSDWLLALYRRLDDVWRLRHHFIEVEQRLRVREVSDLSPALQATRSRQLDRLHDYRVQGIFPRNHDGPGPYAPCFIDRDNRLCAVAHLLVADGQEELAHQVATATNYAYVEEMDFPELASWMAHSGLTKAELAEIQPVYPCPEECASAARALIESQTTFLFQLLVGGTVVGLATTVLNAVSVLFKQRRLLLFGSAVGVVLGASLFYIGLDTLTALVFLAISGSIPCEGAGVVDACHPKGLPPLSPTRARIPEVTAFIGILIYIAGWLGLVKGIMRENFKPYTLLLTLVITLVIGVPILFLLTTFVGGASSFGGAQIGGDLFDEFSLFRYVVFILIVTAGIGLVFWSGFRNLSETEPS